MDTKQRVKLAFILWFVFLMVLFVSSIAQACETAKPSPWQKATLTNFTSYPAPNSDECLNYNGCKWAGYFAGVQGQKSKWWVKRHNIISVHEKDFNRLKGKTLQLRKNGKYFNATVYDKCANSDCNGCCTRNAKPSGNLIDLEVHTASRFGFFNGQIEWRIKP